MAEGRNPLPIIWASLFFSIVLYGIIAFIVVRPASDVELTSFLSSPIAIALHVLALGMLMLSVVLPPVIAAKGASSAAAAERTAWVVRWALIESVAVLGLMLAFLLRDPRAFLLLGIVSAAAMLLAYPRRTEAER